MIKSRISSWLFPRSVSRTLAVCLSLAGGIVSGSGQQQEVSAKAGIFVQALGEIEQLGQPGPVTCGTSLLVDVLPRWAELHAASQGAVESALQRPTFQKSKVSQDGFFRVHYDTTGFRQPALLLDNSSRIPDSHEAYIDSILVMLQQVWEAEIGEVGLLPPPSDGAKGGGPEYDIYVLSQPSNLFGGTYWEVDDIVSTSPNERYATYMEVDNDYLGYRTPGLDGLRVTVAHEFFHAIQVGSYGIWRTATSWDFYFYELASTWMEDVVYDDVNDYLYVVREYLSVSGGRGFRDLQGRALSFTAYGYPWGYYGYERCLWAHFLEARFGRSMIRDIWSAMAGEPFLKAAETALQVRGTTFEREFAWFGFWNYYTADRADTVRYYPEGMLYPRLDPHVRMAYNGYYSAITSGGVPLSDQHFEFTTAGDTIHAAVINVDVEKGANPDAVASSLSLTASSTEQGGMHQKLANGVEMSLAVERPDDWRALYLLSSTGSDSRSRGLPSPNPMSLRESAVLTVPLETVESPTVSVWILSSSLDLVFSREVPVLEQFGRPVVLLPSADLQSSVSSGIHFLVVRSGQTEYTWKIAIIR